MNEEKTATTPRRTQKNRKRITGKRCCRDQGPARSEGPKRERQRNREKLSELISRSNRQADDLGKSKGKENRFKSPPAPPINASAARAKLDSLTHPESPLPKNYAALKVQPPRAKSNKPNAGQRKGQTPLSVRTHFSAY